MLKSIQNISAFLDEIKEGKASWRWALRTFYLLLFVALFANFIANDKPYLCSYQGEWHAPIFKELSVDAGLSQWPVEHINTRWYKLDLDWAFWPPVHYSAQQYDRTNRSTGPFSTQKVRNNWFRHWLGTNQDGQDVLAGMVWGARIALVIGFGAAFMAGLIGIFLGAFAGFFGDTDYQVSRSQLIGTIIGMLTGLFFGFIARQHLWSSNDRVSFMLGGLALFFTITYSTSYLFKKLTLGKWGRQKIALPLDNLIMRLIETLNALPGLLLLLSMVAIIPRASILSVILILGFLSWTGIARFVRGELLRIRSLEYIQAAKTLGLSSTRILWRHALPNAMGPVFVSLTFAVAGAIIVEASLSFLGIGMPEDVISWGSLLSDSRITSEAWWLAIFPGLAISSTIIMLYTLGEAFSTLRK